MPKTEKVSQELAEKIDAYIDEVWKDLTGDIASLIKIESYEDKASAGPGKPWGDGPRAALTRALEIAGRLGLDAHDMEGYIGYADLPGASERQIATIAHADVVPAGDGWTMPPFALGRRNGYMFGRGVLDDKGPLVLSLYAAHYFAREAAAGAGPLPYTLRCIIGANEETGMADVAHYLEHEEEPAFLFSPDADFPVCCGEKGYCGGTFTSPVIEDGNIIELTCGTVSNAIPSLAVARVATDPDYLPFNENMRVYFEGVIDGREVCRLIVTGVGGHASRPEDAVNAGALLVDYILGTGICDGKEREYLELAKRLYDNPDGSDLGIAATDDIFDPLTIASGTINLVDGRLVQTVDCRYPKSTTGDFITKKLLELADQYGVEFVPGHNFEPFLIDPSSDEVSILVDTFNELSGRSDKAFTVGYGTYARFFKNAVGFGPNNSYDKRPRWVGGYHSPDEGVLEDQLKLALKTYIVAISRLMELDFE